jgi:GTPase SAR1 family protein
MYMVVGLHGIDDTNTGEEHVSFNQKKNAGMLVIRELFQKFYYGPDCLLFCCNFAKLRET